MDKGDSSESTILYSSTLKLKKEENEMSGLAIFLVALVAGSISAYFVVFWLADKNFIFTKVGEGRAKAIRKGGAFHRIIIQWEGRVLDNDGFVVSRETEERRFGAIHLVGLPPLYKVFEYDFSWVGLDENGKLKPHDKEPLDYILLQYDQYFCKVEKAEDKEKLPLTATLVLVLKVVNPRMALFDVQNWLELTMEIARTGTRNVLTSKTYDEWVTSDEDISSIIYRRLEEGVTGMAPDMATNLKEIRGMYGVEVVNVQVRGIDPPEGYRDATLKKWNAERDAEEISVLADAEANKISVLADAEANKISVLATAEEERMKKIYKVVDDFGDTGRLIKALEKLEESDLGMASIQVLPGLEGILRAAFGDKPISKEDLIELKEQILEQINRNPIVPD